MKENQQPDAEELWVMITTALKAASDAGTWAFWRERFNTNHPEHVRNQEIMNPAQFAYANWHAAKHVYCANKEIMDKHLHEKVNGEAYPGMTVQIEFFIAMKRVVEEEMERELEQQILKEDEMPMLKTKWEDDEYLIEDENELEQEQFEDEDEEYVRQTQEDYNDEDQTEDDDSFVDDEEELEEEY